MPDKSITRQQAAINDARDDHYDSLTLAREQLGYMESLFHAVRVTLKEQGAASRHHAEQLAGLGEDTAGAWAEDFHQQAERRPQSSRAMEVA